MADYFTLTSFSLRADTAETEIFSEIDAVIDAIQTGFDTPEDAITVWQERSERFRQLFPADTPELPFARFTVHFNDETYPSHGADITSSCDPTCEGRAIVDICGDQVDPFALAGLLRVVIPSALPFRFGWAETCSRMRCDSFGGGFLEVTADRTIPLYGIGQDLDRQHFVVVTRDSAEGLVFWNKATGFGSLGSAGVFNKHEADTLPLPIVDGCVTRWLELPPLGALLGIAA